EWLARYREERLGLLERFVEPLAAQDGTGQLHFAALCADLASAKGPGAVGARLGLEVPEEFTDITWLEWAGQVQLNRVASLYCVASFWTLPELEAPAEIVAVARSLGS